MWWNKKRVKKKWPNKQKLQQNKKIENDFYKEFDECLKTERVEDYTDKWSYQIMVDILSDEYLKWISKFFISGHWPKENNKKPYDIVVRYSIKFWTLSWAMMADITSKAINKRLWYKTVASDFYEIEDVKFSKKDKELLNKMSRRQWEIFIW